MEWNRTQDKHKDLNQVLNKQIKPYNDSKWSQGHLDHYFFNLSKSNSQNFNRKNEIDQGPKVPEVISSNYKNNNVCTLSTPLWNCRSFTYDNKSLINSRDDDIIILNETWDNKFNVSGPTAMGGDTMRTRRETVQIVPPINKTSKQDIFNIQRGKNNFRN